MGSIIDFYAAKGFFLILENYEGKLTKMYELTSGPRVDSRPFATHKKKNFLEQIKGISYVNTLVVGGREVLVVTKGSGTSKSIGFYR